jgi:hypothetical protein
MAIVFDAASEFERTGTTDPQTWTHTPNGTPRAVVVAIIHGTSTTDHVSTVTYGGVALSESIRATDAATELGAAELWFLGINIPTGAQTVSVDLASATTDDIHFVCMTWTAGANTEVIDTDSIVSGDPANPSVTLQYGGREAVAVAALYGGGASPAQFTPNANCTTVHDNDLGAFYSEVIRQTNAGTSDFAVGGTASADDVAYAALAFAERVGTTVSAGVGAAVLAGFVPTVTATANTIATAGLGALVATGLEPTVTATNHQTVAAGVGALTATGFSPTVQIGVSAVAGLGELTATGFSPIVTASDHQTVTAGLGVLVATGFVPTVSISEASSITPGTGVLLAAGFAPTVTATNHQSVTAGTGLVAAAGFSPTVTASDHQTVTPGVGAAIVAGFSPTVSASDHQIIAAGLGQLIAAGFAPTVTATSGSNTNAEPGTGVLAATGFSPSISITEHVVVRPGTGVVVLTGLECTVIGTLVNDTLAYTTVGPAVIAMSINYHIMMKRRGI